MLFQAKIHNIAKMHKYLDLLYILISDKFYLQV